MEELFSEVRRSKLAVGGAVDGRVMVVITVSTPANRATSPQTGQGNVLSCCDLLPSDFPRILGDHPLRELGPIGAG